MKTETPAELISELLRVVRGQFCGEMAAKEWFQSQRFFKRVLLYPAAWLSKRGVSLPPQRYKAIILEVFQGVKQRGNTAAVKYWPGYLLHCVQEHMKHHGEEYYAEGKSIRALAERALLTAGTQRRTEPAITDRLAEAAAVVSARGPKKVRPRSHRPAQGTLL